MQVNIDKSMVYLTPKKVYDSLKEPRKEFREIVCQTLEISEVTFWRNLKENKWNNLQLQAIEKIAKTFEPVIDHSKL